MLDRGEIDYADQNLFAANPRNYRQNKQRLEQQPPEEPGGFYLDDEDLGDAQRRVDIVPDIPVADAEGLDKRLDLSALLENPPSDYREFWLEVERAVAIAVGQEVVDAYAQRGGGYTQFAKNRTVVLDGDPETVAQMYKFGEVDLKEAMRLVNEAGMLLGSLNRSPSLVGWNESAIPISIGSPFHASDPELTKAFLGTNIDGQVEAFLYEQDASITTRSVTVNRISGRLQRAGMLRLTGATSEQDYTDALLSFDQAQKVRRVLINAKGSRFTNKRIEIRKRYHDTAGLMVHAGVMAGGLSIPEAKSVFAGVQLDLLDAFEETMLQKPEQYRTNLEWMLVALGNYNIFRTNEFGTSYVAHGMPYQEKPPEKMTGNDIYRSQKLDVEFFGRGSIAVVQSKLRDWFYKNQKYCGGPTITQYHHFKPITIVTAKDTTGRDLMPDEFEGHDKKNGDIDKPEAIYVAFFGETIDALRDFYMYGHNSIERQKTEHVEGMLDDLDWVIAA